MASRTSPRRGRSGAAGVVDHPDRTKPVRVTVDLDPDDYEALREWAHTARMSHSDVFRTLLRLLTSDESLATAVRDSEA